MKKLLSLAFVAAIIGASVGCDDKKSTGGSGTKSAASNASAASAASNVSTTK